MDCVLTLPVSNFLISIIRARKLPSQDPSFLRPYTSPTSCWAPQDLALPNRSQGQFWPPVTPQNSRHCCSPASERVRSNLSRRPRSRAWHGRGRGRGRRSRARGPHGEHSHVGRMHGLHVARVQQLVVHRDEHAQAVLQLLLVNDAGAGGCRRWAGRPGRVRGCLGGHHPGPSWGLR